MKAHIGHIDNRKRISKELKNFSFENRPLPYQKSSIYSTFFFPVKSTERGLGMCSMILTEISDFRPRLEDGNACYVS